LFLFQLQLIKKAVYQYLLFLLEASCKIDCKMVSHLQNSCFITKSFKMKNFILPVKND